MLVKNWLVGLVFERGWVPTLMKIVALGPLTALWAECGPTVLAGLIFEDAFGLSFRKVFGP